MKITVKAHVRTKQPRITKDEKGILHIYVTQPPVDNQANRAIIAALSEYLNIPKTNITLRKGENSRTKVFEII